MQNIADAGSVADMFRSTETDSQKAIGDSDPMESSRNLFDGTEGQTYIVRQICTDDDEMNGFLFRLGCYSGEPITIISKKKKSCIVAIKDSRYTLDRALCEAIII